MGEAAKANGRRGRRARRVALALALALLPVPAVQTFTHPTVAQAAINDPAAIDVWTQSVMGNIKSRVWRAADGNTNRVVYLLDGFRARNDFSGWEVDTDIPNFLAARNINVVTPVGGASSFYTDWYAAPTAGAAPMKWETYLTQELPTALETQLGLSRTRNGIVGVSMGGGAAVTLAAWHPDQFSFAGSLSGYLNPTSPGMRGAFQTALLGFNEYDVTAMWGAPWDPAWKRNDPAQQVLRLRNNGTRLWIYNGSSLPALGPEAGNPDSFGALSNGMGLEFLAALNARSFQISAALVGEQNVVFRFPLTGIHAWKYWDTEVRAMEPDLGTHIG